MAAAIAGIAGCIFANWAEIITPNMFSLGQSSEIIIWTIVGGAGTLAGPIIGAGVLGYLKIALGENSGLNNFFIMGVVLIAAVLFLPRGIFPTMQTLAGAAGSRGRSRPKALAPETPPCRLIRVVETHGLSVHFGGVAALDRVSVAIAEKELRCLIGPNGAGKSTFFKCLTGQLKPSEGTVHIRGEETTGWNPHEIARLGVGIKTQVPSVMNGLTARENIWLAAKRRNTARNADRIVAETLDRLKIGEFAGTEVVRLAHGQRQLVELGIVLAGKALADPARRAGGRAHGEEVQRMVEVIREMNTDASLIIVEHDMHFIRSIAKIVTVFHQGRVLIEAPVETVLADQKVRDVYLGRKG